jgi:CheY-like chemotaxis protein
MSAGAYGLGRRHTVQQVRLVLVDNDPMALEVIELDLGLEGHEIVGTAAQGAEAVELILATRPDVAVLDFRMPPGIDGLEVARRLRREAPEIGLVLYSSHVQPKLLDEAERLAVPYLRKGELAALRRAVIEQGMPR